MDTILKLVKVQGNLKNGKLFYCSYTNSLHTNSFYAKKECCSIVEPYGIVHVKPKAGELRFCLGTHSRNDIPESMGIYVNPVNVTGENDNCTVCVKVVIEPNQFNLEEIAELGLMDGDKIDGHWLDTGSRFVYRIYDWVMKLNIRKN